jgi:uncharacterized protein YbjT (DUF2867 family)
MKKAILFGATGHVGSYLLQLLLDDPIYNQIIIVVRAPVGISHPRLTVLQGDFLSLASLKEKLVADDVFITLGASDAQIDRSYPILAAELCHQNGATSIFLITAVGANPASRMRYIRIKGEVEQIILSMAFEHTFFFRPGMIQGKRTHYHSMERTMMAIWKVIDPLFIGKLQSYKGMHAHDIATAIHRAAQYPQGKNKIYHWKEMSGLLLTFKNQC